MSRHRIAQRISRLEQTFGCRVEVLTPAQREARNESLAELFARSLGLSCQEMATALKARASAINQEHRVTDMSPEMNWIVIAGGT